MAGTEGVVVFRRTGGVGGIDAIDEYSRRLTDALRTCGVWAHYEWRGLSSVANQSRMPPWVLLQYNPFRYGRWGFAPGLVRDALRLRSRGVALLVMVHEAWVPLRGARGTMMGVWQRAQLRCLLGLADGVLASTEALVGELGHDAVHVPVASNIDPAGESRAQARRALGLHDGLVIALFGRAHESRALGLAARACRAIIQAVSPLPVAILNLGADAPRLDLPVDALVRQPGAMAEEDVSRHLSASDLILLPFTDGLSTRRGTLMAALAHGRAVAGLRGSRTDLLLLEHPDAVASAPLEQPDAYVELAVGLALDAARRDELGLAGRRLYDERFSWPNAAARVAEAVALVAGVRAHLQVA